jgi:hypothetical protein
MSFTFPIGRLLLSKKATSAINSMVASMQNVAKCNNMTFSKLNQNFLATSS